MKILQLCHKPPFPTKDGGCIAMHNITCGLLDAGHQVKLITAFTHKHDLELETMSEAYKSQTDIEGVFIDTKVNIVDAFSNLITQDSYNISRFFNADLDIKLEVLLKRKKFDIIHLESLFMTPYIGTIRRHSKAPVVLRSHNLEYIIWERMAIGTRNPAKRAYLKYLSKKLKAYELSTFKEVDGIAAISDTDFRKYRKIGYEKPMVTIPFGIDTSAYNCNKTVQEPPTLFHIGAMDWLPNIEAIFWFTSEIMPEVVKAVSEAKLHLAGRSLHSDILPVDLQNITLHGEVDSAQAFMNDHSIMVVPLLSAGGIRIKIIEAMACGKAVISTSVGAEGIDAKDKEHLLIANTKKEFIDAIAYLYTNPKEIRRLGENARKLALEHFDNRQITKDLIQFYQKLIG